MPARGRLRAYGLAVVLLVAAGIFLASVQEHYPVREWLFWRYAGYWLWCLLFAVACLCGGHLVLGIVIGRVSGERLRLDQHLLFAFALGVLLFYQGMFSAGILGLYGRAFALLWPLLLVAAGAVPFLRHLRPRLRRLQWAGAARSTPASRLMTLSVTAFGLAGAAMVYFLVLTPDNVAYDSRWYHLALAEHYVAEGAVRRFPEGSYQATLPHLASYLYAWAFQVPGTQLFDRIEVSAHLEFVLFLATLAAIPVLVRWIVPGPAVRGAWAALFLFPGILLYDSSLSAAADHIAAFWAVPIYLAFVRAWAAPTVRRCLLLGAMMAGAASTKYQTLSLLMFPAGAIGLRVALLGVRTRRARVLGGPAAGALLAIVVLAPHWLKNWVWYGAPFYPFLQGVFRGRPWTPDSAHLVEAVFEGMQRWSPSGTLGERLVQTARATFTFSLRPNDWPTFHGVVPVFGSLFTLSLLALPLVGRARRLWALVIATHVGVFVWYWTSHQDRYLQVLLPWMVVATAATLVLVWRIGNGVARGALALLVGLQIVWGGDVYFIPTHAVLSDTPIISVVRLLSSGYRKDYRDRFQRLGPLHEIGLQLAEEGGLKAAAGQRPPKKVLLHESHMRLGLGVPAVSDWGGWQGGISYGRMGSPRGVYEALRAMGVTHLLWAAGSTREWDSLAGDLLFLHFATRFTQSQRTIAGQVLGAMPPSPPDPGPLGWNDRVLFAGCPGGTYEPGLYRLEQLIVPQIAPPSNAHPQPLVPLSPVRPEDQWAEAGYVVLEPSCYTRPASLARGFTPLATRGKLQLLVRP